MPADYEKFVQRVKKLTRDAYLDKPADDGKHGDTAVLELCIE